MKYSISILRPSCARVLTAVIYFFAVFLLLLLSSEPAFALDPKLPARLDQALSKLNQRKNMQGAQVGLRVINASSGREIYSFNADEPMVPASVMKIVTSAAALNYLGAEHRFPTEIFLVEGGAKVDVRLDPSAGVGRSKVSKSSNSHPDLVIRGYGDPTMVEEDMLRLAGLVRKLGIEDVSSIIIDDTLFLNPPGPSGYEAYRAGVSATSVNNNAYVVATAPSRNGADSASVHMTPGLQYSLSNRVKTRNTRGTTVNVTQSPPSNTFNPSALGKRVGSYFTFNEPDVKVGVSGKISSSKKLDQRYFAVRNPTHYFASLLKHYLVVQGVRVHGSLLRGETPQKARLVHTFKSAPLKEILSKMNHYSSNHIASQILFALGQDSSGFFKKEVGIERMSSVLTSLGFESSQFAIADGSGLDRQNRLTSSQLVSVLAALYQDFSVAPDFISSLSRFAHSGTLKKRRLLPKSSVATTSGGALSEEKKRSNAVWGKTGTLNGVSSLAGYLTSRDNEILAYSIIINGGETKSAAAKIEDELVKIISGIGSK